MPPCFDVYVWVRSQDHERALATFIEHYVDTDNPGDPRFDAFARVYVDEKPTPGDRAVLAQLRRDPSSTDGFSIYLRARSHHEAIVTLTDEGDLVLGLGIDDPLNDPEVAVDAARLLSALKDEFHAVAGIAGVELAPPRSVAEWRDADMATVREGEL